MVALKCRQWCILFSRIFHERGGSNTWVRASANTKEPLSIREIVTDEEILSKPCEAATAEDAAIADDLVRETLLASDEAMCLAANQIGETRRASSPMPNDAGRPQVMYNPRIAQKLEAATRLSRPASRARSRRPSRATIGCA